MRETSVLLCLILLLVPVSAIVASAEVPDLIPSTREAREEPIWVSAEEAVANGALRQELFSAFELTTLDRTLEMDRAARHASVEEKTTAAEGCATWTITSSEHLVEELTMANLFARARIAFLGTVIDEKPGFLYGTPTTLYEIHIDRLLKAPPDREIDQSVYLSFFHVEIRVGEEVICQKEMRYPDRPLPGKRILVFAYTVPDWQPTIINSLEEELFFEDDDGKVSFPARFGEILDRPGWSFIENQVSELGEEQEPSEAKEIKEGS